MFFVILITATIAFLTSFAVCRTMRWAAPRFGLVDEPNHRKVHVQPTPIGGGVGIWFGIVVSLAIAILGLCTVNGDKLAAGNVATRSDRFSMLSVQTGHCDGVPSPFPAAMETICQVPTWFSVLPQPEHLGGLLKRSVQLLQLLGLATGVFVLGLLDDVYHLSWKFRLLCQFGFAVAAVTLGWKASLFFVPPFLANTLSVLWIVGLINSFNMLDNMNGLSGGVAMICAFFLGIVMFVSPNPSSLEPQFFILGFLCVVIGSLLGFFVWNNPYRGAIFMGSCGAYLLGFLLAVLTLSATFAGYKPSQWQGIFVPVCILAVPLYDTFSVILIRLRQGRSPFEADKCHFSHRLVDIGLTKPQAVLTIYLVTTICAIAAVLLYFVPPICAVLVAMQVGLILSLITILESVRRK